jgi:gamma-glutamylputrescine oxidase
MHVNGLDRRLDNAVFPVQTYITVTKPVDPAVLKTAINTEHAIYTMRFSTDYYRILEGSRILWGGRVGLWKHPSNIARTMMRDMFDLYPQLKGHVEPDVSWAGDLAYSPHKMPQIGQFEEGYWYNTAYGGHGLCPTTVGGEVIAAAIAKGDKTHELFAPFGPFYTGGKMGRYIAQLVYWWWRFRDETGI